MAEPRGPGSPTGNARPLPRTSVPSQALRRTLEPRSPPQSGVQPGCWGLGCPRSPRQPPQRGPAVARPALPRKRKAAGRVLGFPRARCSGTCGSALGSPPSPHRGALGRAPPSSSSNCYVKIPRTCFCKELKEGEEEIVFVGVSLSL